jgi:hypothetical protein
MGPNTTVQQFLDRINELNRYLLFFPEECPPPQTQDEIIEILDQAKPPNWHEAMVSANIDIFEMAYKLAVLYFIRLENLDKTCRTNGPALTVAVDNNTSLTTSSVPIVNARRNKRPKSGVTTVTKITTVQPNVEKLQRPSSTKSKT